MSQISLVISSRLGRSKGTPLQYFIVESILRALPHQPEKEQEAGFLFYSDARLNSQTGRHSRNNLGFSDNGIGSRLHATSCY